MDVRIQQLSTDFALRSLQSGLDDLAGAEAARRKAEFGPNRVEQVRRESPVLRFVKGFTHLFALILFAAAALAFFAESRSPGGGMGGVGVAVLIVVAINGLFSFWQEYKAERAVAALQRLLPHDAEVLPDGKAVRLAAERLVPGDVVRLAEGDDVPADCRVLDAAGLRVNNATLTGESMPQSSGAGPSDEPEALHAADVLLAGTSVVSGEARALVFATGTHTEFGNRACAQADAAGGGGDRQRGERRPGALGVRLESALILIIV